MQTNKLTQSGAHTQTHTYVHLYAQHMTGDILPGLQFVAAAVVVNIHLQQGLTALWGSV